MRTKQALVVILGIALVALLRLSPKAVDMGNPVILVQPPPEDTNCYPANTNVLCAPEPAPQFLSTGVTNQCAEGAMIVAWATYTNIPGTVTTTITYSNGSCPPLVTTNTVSSAILTNWWEATGGAVPAGGPGLGASFSLTNCGGGTVYFYLKYSNAPPCVNATTIGTSIDYSIDPDCHHHNPGSPSDHFSCACVSDTNWIASTNSLCSDSFYVSCIGGVVRADSPDGECGICTYDYSDWYATYTFCLCKAKIVATHFYVVDIGTNSPTRGQGINSDWTCTTGCTNSPIVPGH